MTRRLDLRDRVLLVTGGARGIGLETARAAAARGAVVAVLDADGDAAARAADSLAGAALGVTADVTDLAALDAAVKAIVDRLGGIDVVVANAGIGPRVGTVDAGDREHQRRVLDVNLHGVWHTMWAAVPHVVERRGHVVAISSVAAFVQSPGCAAYGASKAAVEQLARAMRVELAPTQTTVGVAHFGMVATDLVRAFENDPIVAALEARAARLTRRVTPEAAAAALVDGIEQRAPRTVFPARWRAPYLLRGVAGPLSDAWATRDARMRDQMAALRARDLAR